MESGQLVAVLQAAHNMHDMHCMASHVRRRSSLRNTNNPGSLISHLIIHIMVCENTSDSVIEMSRPHMREWCIVFMTLQVAGCRSLWQRQCCKARSESRQP